MNIFKVILRWLGFGPDAMASDPELADTTADTEEVPVRRAAAPSGAVEVDPAMHDAIFARILEVFNQSLPSFLAESVDRDAQVRYLRERFDQGMNDYLAALDERAKSLSESQWQTKQDELNAELAEVRLKAEDVERRSDDLQKKQLSADRQKRALAERVHDLEAKLATLESEREQLELENRSLVSRMKASAVYQEDLDKANAELAQLRQDPTLVSKEREDALNEQIKNMQLGIDSLKEQVKIGDEIRDELRAKLKESESALAARGKEVEQLNALVDEFNAAVTRMEAAQSEMAAVKEAHDRAIADKDAEIASLKETVAENIKRQNEREKVLREEIEELREARLPKVQIDFAAETETVYSETPAADDARAVAVANDDDDDDDADVMMMLSDDDLSGFAASFEAAKQAEPSAEEATFDIDALPPRPERMSKLEISALPEDEPESEEAPAAAVSNNARPGRAGKERPGNAAPQKRKPKYEHPSLF